MVGLVHIGGWAGTGSGAGTPSCLELTVMAGAELVVGSGVLSERAVVARWLRPAGRVEYDGNMRARRSR